MRRAVAASAAACLLALTGQAAGAGDPIMPLSEVRPGMVGEARTVVRGTQVVTFPVTVLDVQRISSGPGGALILIRAEGPLMRETGGIAQGMSGSPVYVTGADGVPRVIGAVAFGTGDEANVIGGITPIERMLDAARGRRALERHAGTAGPVRASRPLRVVTSRAAAVRAEAARPGLRALYPLRRWTAAGVSPRLLGSLRRSFAARGVQLDSTGGRSRRPPTPLVPGASVTALVVGGDTVVGAIGTVTYVDGATLLAFGHPLFSSGRARFLLADGYVYQTIPAPISNESYKLGEPGTVQGTVIGDRADGVVGRIGPSRQAIPVVSIARHRTRATSATVTSTVADDERTVPLITDVLQGEPVLRVLDGLGGGTLEMRMTVRTGASRRPLVYRNLYAAAGDILPVTIGPLTMMATALMQNGLRPVAIRSIRVEQTLSSQVRAARIVGASVRPRHVRPGQRATLVLALQPWRAARRLVRLSIRIPVGIEPGPRRPLRIVPSNPVGFDPGPGDLSSAIGADSPVRAQRVLARLGGRLSAGPGSPAARVLRAVRAELPRRHDAIRVVAPGQDADAVGAGRRVAVPWVVYGGRALVRVHVLPTRGGRERR